jgi:hypothetical protein
VYGQTSEPNLLIVIDIVLGGDKDSHNLILGKARLQTQIWGFENVTLVDVKICSSLQVRTLVLIQVPVPVPVLLHGSLILIPALEIVVEED